MLGQPSSGSGGIGTLPVTVIFPEVADVNVKSKAILQYGLYAVVMDEVVPSNAPT